MGTVTFRTVARVGVVVVKINTTSRRYYVGWWDPTRKRMRIEACRTDKKGEALEQARVINAGLKRNPAARFARRDPKTVVQAVAETIAGARTTNARTRQVLEANARYFLAFMRRRCGGVALWADVRNEHLEQWAEELVAGGLSRKTASNYLALPVQVSRYMADTYPADGLYFKLRRPAGVISRAAEPRALDYLDAAELLALADVAGQTDKRVEAVVLLSGICGLRISEVALLRADGFDLGLGTIDVRQSKTAAGQRTIPLPRMVLERLRPLIDETPGPHLLMTWQGNPYQPHRLGDIVRPVMRAAAVKTGNEHLLVLAPKHLRKSAFNLLKAAGVDPEYRRAYCGHAETTVAGRHYEDRNSRRATDRLRREVIAPLELYLSVTTDKKLTRPQEDQG